MDYYGSMTPSLRRSRLAAAAFLTLVALAAQAQPDVPAPAAPTSPAPIIEPGSAARRPGRAGEPEDEDDAPKPRR